MGEAVLLLQFAPERQFDLDRTGGDGKDPRADVYAVDGGEETHVATAMGTFMTMSGLADRT